MFCFLQVRWQEAVAGSGVVIGMGKQGRVFKTVDEEEEEEGELDEDGNLCVKCSFDPDESEAAVNSWGALFTEQRNRYPMIIGAGVCLLAGTFLFIFVCAISLTACFFYRCGGEVRGVESGRVRGARNASSRRQVPSREPRGSRATARHRLVRLRGHQGGRI